MDPFRPAGAAPLAQPDELSQQNSNDGVKRRWTSWGLYIWLSLASIIVAFLNVVTKEDNLFDMISSAVEDKMFLVSCSHFCFLVTVGFVYLVVKMSLGEIRETERENVIDRCRSMTLDWLIFLVFARPLFHGQPASVLRLSFGMLYLLAMRIIHQLLKLRTGALADYRPNIHSMLKIVLTSFVLLLVNLQVFRWCINFFQSKGLLATNPSIIPTFQNLISCGKSIFNFRNDDNFKEFIENHVNPNFKEILERYDFGWARILTVMGVFTVNLVRFVCPIWFLNLVQVLGNQKFGAVSWLAFESLQITIDAFFTTVKGIMHMFDFELQSRTHRTWRDLTIARIVAELLEDLFTSSLSTGWIIALIVAGSSRNVYGIPIFLISDMIQNIIGCYNTALSLYRYLAMESFLSQFPKATLEDVDRQDTCIVCRETLYVDSGDPVELGCSHVFHYSCLKSWYTQQQNCPICRSEIDPSTKKKKGRQIPPSPPPAETEHVPVDVRVVDEPITVDEYGGERTTLGNRTIDENKIGDVDDLLSELRGSFANIKCYREELQELLSQI
eukprot:GHVH01011280.1.p1 GENE.GHVH01011280.1~~GHVH01011280.1.p1  ORF type:complete len:556 (+),score=63.55 GHVH01011280.1:13-1680(+)